MGRSSLYRIGFLTVAALVALPMSTSADVLDFEDLAPGEIVSAAIGASGSGPVIIRGELPTRRRSNSAVAFDSTLPSGGDFDLGTPNEECGGLGNGTVVGPGTPFENCDDNGVVLIVAQFLDDLDGDGLVDDPDDADYQARDGIFLSFDFSALESVSIESIDLIDIDGNGPAPRVELFGANDVLIDTVSIPNTMPNNGKVVLDLGPTPGVVNMIVHVQGSGAIDNIRFSESKSCLEVEEQISIDGGSVFENADAVGDPDTPIVAFPSDALYRIVLRNCGATLLENIEVSENGSVVVPELDVGEIEIVTVDDIPGLNVPNRCESTGTFINMAEAVASDGTTASDTAVLVCVGEAAIALRKQVSVDGGATFVDAEDPESGDAPTVAGPATLEYRLIIDNTGSGALRDVTVDDPTLSILDSQLGDMPSGAQRIVTKSDIPQLEIENGCLDAGTFVNSASVTAQAETGSTITASDSAAVICAGEAQIDIRKQISIDGGLTYSDADAEGDADVPIVSAPSGALYRLLVVNDGSVALSSVVVTDEALGIIDVAVGDLAVGEEVTLTSEDIPELQVPERCAALGVFTNVARAEALSADGSEVTDSDAAVMVCVGNGAEIQLLKQISVDDGITYLDADTATGPDTPEVVAPADVLYRFVVRNVSDVDLESVLVSDSALDIIDYAVGSIPIDGEVVITVDDLSQLEQAPRCDVAGEFTNVATVTARSALDPDDATTDSDPAVLLCQDAVPLGRLGDRVWEDLDGNGLQSSGEPGLVGVEVTLVDADGGRTVINTEQNGRYRFDDLAVGVYTVEVDPATLPPNCSPTYDSDGIDTPNTATISLREGQSRQNIDFGCRRDVSPPGSVAIEK